MLAITVCVIRWMTSRNILVGECGPISWVLWISASTNLYHQMALIACFFHAPARKRLSIDKAATAKDDISKFLKLQKHVCCSIWLRYEEIWFVSIEFHNVASSTSMSNHSAVGHSQCFMEDIPTEVLFIHFDTRSIISALIGDIYLQSCITIHSMT